MATNLVSVEEERQLGSQLSAETEAELPLLDDPQIVGYIQNLGAQVVEAIPPESRIFDYQFQVVDLEDVNAFAIPAGYIYFYRGLLEFVENEAQLAGVVAHEIIHVNRRHGTQRLTQMYGVQLLTSALVGQDPAVWQEILVQTVAVFGYLSYSRAQERESDELGAYLMHQAGLNAMGMVQFFERLLAAQGGEVEGFEARVARWLSTHPLTADRKENTQRLVEEQGLDEGRLTSPQFTAMQQRLGQIPPPKVSIGSILEMLKK